MDVLSCSPQHDEIVKIDGTQLFEKFMKHLCGYVELWIIFLGFIERLLTFLCDYGEFILGLLAQNF